jgi:hypothetical protein
MKKTVNLLLVTGCFLLAAATAQGHSEWAKYKNTSALEDDVNLPSKYINDDGTLNCCGCHWNTKHAGPGTGFCD